MRAPRKRPQQRRSQATVDAILDAANDLFSRNGFASTSTNAVARRAGVSIGSLYQYFPHKLALLEALRERHVKGLWEEIGLACDEARTRTWPGALRHVISRCGAYNGRHAALMQILHQELPFHPPTADQMIIAQSTFQQRFRRFLEAHRNSITVGIDQAMFVLPALGRGLFTSAAVEPQDAVAADRLVDEAVAVMLGYLT